MTLASCSHIAYDVSIDADTPNQSLMLSVNEAFTLCICINASIIADATDQLELRPICTESQHQCRYKTDALGRFWLQPI